MKIAALWKTMISSFGICVLVTGCGGGDSTSVQTAEPCASIAATALAPGQAAPVSATGAYLCAAGIGASDLEASVRFYKALGMVERARLTRYNRNEVVLSSADNRGSQLVLFTYTDGSSRNYRQNPGKIVFYVRDATAFGAALAAAGGTLLSPPVLYQGRMVGFGRDRDQNLVEIASDATAVHSFISAVGVGVSDLEAAKNFYVNALDMKVLVKLSVTKPTGPGTVGPWYDEYILQSSAGRGSAVVLMTYTDGTAKNYNNNPVKLSLRVNDPAAYAQRITAANVAGAAVMMAPGPDWTAGGATVGYATDANGTLLEIVKSPN